MQNTEVEQRSGLDVRLECRIKANPLINHYWMKNDEVLAYIKVTRVFTLSEISIKVLGIH